MFRKAHVGACPHRDTRTVTSGGRGRVQSTHRAVVRARPGVLDLVESRVVVGGDSVRWRLDSPCAFPARLHDPRAKVRVRKRRGPVRRADRVLWGTWGSRGGWRG